MLRLAAALKGPPLATARTVGRITKCRDVAANNIEGDEVTAKRRDCQGVLRPPLELQAWRLFLEGLFYLYTQVDKSFI